MTCAICPKAGPPTGRRLSIPLLRNLTGGTVLTRWRRMHWVLAGTLGAYGIYSLLYIWRTSFVVSGQRVFSLFDDAMISMRYARNLAQGYGLVWNPGGPAVEGFTNPLWVGYMALWHLLPIDPTKISLAIQLTSAVCLIANLALVWHIARLLSAGNGAVALGAVILTAFYLPLNTWALQGMEVGLLALITMLGIWLVLRQATDRRLTPCLYALLGLSTFVRIDMIVPSAVLGLYLVWTDSTRRRRHAWVLGAVLLGALAIQTAARLWYFGDPLPNTYYLKVTGYPLLPRIAHGLAVFAGLVWQMNPVLFLCAFAVLLFRRDKRLLLLAAVFVGQAAYSIYVGGDAWEGWGGSNRYLSIAMPGFFILLANGLSLQVIWRRGPADPSAPPRRLQLGAVVLAALLCSIAWVYVSPLLGLAGVILAAAAVLAWSGRALRTARLGEGRSVGHGLSTEIRSGHRQLAVDPFVLALALFPALVTLDSVHGPTGLAEALLAVPPYHVLDSQASLAETQVLDQVTFPSASVAVVWAGAISYFANRNTVDLLGKVDPRIAHEAAHPASPESGPVDFWPGHMKWDYAYSVGELQPDVVMQLWAYGPGGLNALTLMGVPPDAQPYLAPNYVRVVVQGWPLYVRKDSANVRWSLVSR